MINTGLCGLLSSNPFLSDIRARKMLVHDVIYRRQKYYEYYRLDQEKEKEQRWRTSAFPKCWETFDWKAVVENCSLLGITEKAKNTAIQEKKCTVRIALIIFSDNFVFNSAFLLCFSHQRWMSELWDRWVDPGVSVRLKWGHQTFTPNTTLHILSAAQ